MSSKIVRALIFVSLCLFLSESIRLKAIDKKYKVCRKLSVPINEISDLREALSDIEKSIEYHNTTDAKVKDETVTISNYNVYNYYNISVQNISTILDALAKQYPDSVIDQCIALYDSIDNAKTQLQQYKDNVKVALKLIDDILDGDISTAITVTE
jgi:ABC-type transporter Mla subunit MlaD